MQSRSPAHHGQRFWSLGAAVVLAAGSTACTAKATDPGDDDPDGSVVRLPIDAEPGPDAASQDVDATVDTPDAAPPCALPLTVDIGDADFAYFLYDHPKCSGGEGLGDGATVVFEDRIDDEPYFHAIAPEERWEVQEIDYGALDCIVEPEQSTVVCDAGEVGELIPLQLVDGSTQLDVEFRLDHDAQQVTVESVTYTE